MSVTLPPYESFSENIAHLTTSPTLNRQLSVRHATQHFNSRHLSTHYFSARSPSEPSISKSHPFHLSSPHPHKNIPKPPPREPLTSMPSPHLASTFSVSPSIPSNRTPSQAPVTCCATHVGAAVRVIEISTGHGSCRAPTHVFFGVVQSGVGVGAFLRRELHSCQHSPFSRNGISFMIWCGTIYDGMMV